MLAMIIFVLEFFKFHVTLNSFTRFPSYANFIFATVSSCCCSLAAVDPCCYSLASSSSLAAARFSSSAASFSTLSFSLPRPYPILSIILLYNKKAVPRTLFSLSTSASRVAVTGADIALYNFEIVFLKNVFVFYIIRF